MVWLVLGGTLIVTLVAAILLQKKSKEINQLSEELVLCRKEKEETMSNVGKLESKFEVEMNEVVQASIEKINHAEQAKEDAVKAAHDNYEVAAEAHALLREKEDLIKKLQGS